MIYETPPFTMLKLAVPVFETAVAELTISFSDVKTSDSDAPSSLMILPPKNVLSKNLNNY